MPLRSQPVPPPKKMSQSKKGGISTLSRPSKQDEKVASSLSLLRPPSKADNLSYLPPPVTSVSPGEFQRGPTSIDGSRPQKGSQDPLLLAVSLKHSPEKCKKNETFRIMEKHPKTLFKHCAGIKWYFLYVFLRNNIRLNPPQPHPQNMKRRKKGAKTRRRDVPTGQESPQSCSLPSPSSQQTRKGGRRKSSLHPRRRCPLMGR